MFIRRVRAKNIRLYTSLEIKPSPKLNIVIGSNASGKTTLLECLYFIGRGRSFRATKPAEMTGPSSASWSVFAELEYEKVVSKIGLAWKDGEQMQRLNGRKALRPELAQTLPLQVITPSAHRIVEDGPSYRREYLDWGVFHGEQRFYDAWNRYQRVLRQRNQALRQKMTAEAIRPWDKELAFAGLEITEYRQKHLAAIENQLAQVIDALLGVQGIRIEFQQGWPHGQNFQELLTRELEQHRRMGTTSHGPHRAEIRLRLAEGLVKSRFSRGQQKLLVAALVLAQCATLIESGVPPPVLLFDDFSAELSVDYQERLAALLISYPGQIFVTAFEIPPSLSKIQAEVFHVEQGQISVAQPE